MNSKKTMAHDDVTHGITASTIRIQENKWFGNANRINQCNFNAATLKLAEKFDNPLSHLFIFGDAVKKKK